MEFLSSLYLKGLSYSALNTARSAVSTFSFASEYENIGSNPLVSRLLKGVFERRPPAPRYDETWDVGIVFGFLKTVEPLSRLCLLDLTKKTICLMALVSGKRRNALHQLKVTNMKICDDHVVFTNVKQKQDKPGKPIKPISFYKYDIDKELCVFRCILYYITVTKDLRTDDGFFIRTKKPHRHATSETLSNWIKDVLHSSGVDIATYSSHSTRSAAASAANKTISVDTILNAVGWTCEKTFARFYNKEIKYHPVQQMATAVLSTAIKQ